MTREEKLEAIYKEMANKEVSFGCKYKFIKKYQYCDWAWFEPGDIITLCKRDEKYEDSFLTTFFRDIALIKKDVYDYVEIIGHPVMINRIEYMLNNTDYKKVRMMINKDELILPVEKWNDAAINILYGIIKNV